MIKYNRNTASAKFHLRLFTTINYVKRQYTSSFPTVLAIIIIVLGYYQYSNQCGVKEKTNVNKSSQL